MAESGRKYLPTAGVKGLWPAGQTGGQDVGGIGMEVFKHVTHEMVLYKQQTGLWILNLHLSI